MKKKIIYMSLLLILVFAFNTINVFATPGALRKNSIKTCSNGITYGLHGDGAGGTHWHQAEQQSKMSSGWGPVGEPLSGDPCPKNNSNTNQNNNSTNNQTNNNQSKPSTNNEKKKSDDTSISKLNVNGKSIYPIEESMEHTVNKNKVDISVDLKDKNAKYEIEGNVEELSKEQANEFKIIVTAEDGTKKTYLLNITREVKKSYVSIISLTINGSSVSFSFDKKEAVSLSNSEDKLDIDYKLSNDKANLIITSDGKNVKNGDKIKVGETSYLLTVVDEDGNENSYELVVERMSIIEEIMMHVVGTLMFAGGIVVLIYYFKKQKIKRNSFL